MDFLIVGAIAVVLLVALVKVDAWLERKEAEEKAAKPKPEPKRARNAKGHFKADDPSTPDVNEAWEGGKAPKPKKKKTTKKKKVVKKTKQTK